MQNKLRQVEAIAKKLEKFRMKDLSNSKSVAKAVSIVRQALSSAMHIAKTLGGEFGETLVRIAGGASRGLRVVGIVAGAVLLPLDVYTLVTTFI